MHSLLRTFILSVLLFSGLTYADSFSDLKRNAERGDAKAQFNLGLMYGLGRGVKKNYSMTKELAGRSCDGGLQTGCDLYRELNEGGVR